MTFAATRRRDETLRQAKESLRVHHSNRINKNDTADFLNSGEQTEQNFCRTAIKCNYVPKTNYSGFAPEQAVGERNGKKRGGRLFGNLTMLPRVVRGCRVNAQNPGKRTDSPWIIQ
jgi:hypothetical protein